MFKRPRTQDRCFYVALNQIPSIIFHSIAFYPPKSKRILMTAEDISSKVKASLGNQDYSRKPSSLTILSYNEYYYYVTECIN